MSTWVPVPQRAIAPEGTSYAYVRYNGAASAEVIVHTLKPAGDKQILKKSGGSLMVIGYTPDGVYIHHISTSGIAIWLVDPQRQSSRLVHTEPRNGVFWLAVDNGDAWGIGPSADPGSQPTLIRLNLQTGLTSAWLAPQTPSVSLLGFTSDGAPVVALFSDSGVRISIVTAQFTAKEIAKFPSNPGFPTAYSDRLGTWFSSGTSVWLYSGQAFRKLAVTETVAGAILSGESAAIPAPGPLGVAGPCLPN
jgi:hypothetical protein